MMKNSLLIINFLVIVFLTGSAKAEPVSTGRFNNTAIGGHDSIVYHQSAKLGQHDILKGKKAYTINWQGAQWRFVTQESANRFQSDPRKYAPAYNGFCSNALSLGEGLVPTKGTVWEFFDDTLHMFYARKGLQRWLNGDSRAYKQEADKAWTILKSK